MRWHGYADLIAEKKKGLFSHENKPFYVPFGGDKRDRTADLLNAIQALSQLSYTPIPSRVEVLWVRNMKLFMVEISGIEPLTS